MVILQRIFILTYIFFILAGAGLIAGIVIIIILALIIIGLLVYCIFWKRRQNKDGHTELHTKNSKKRPISPKELGMGILRDFLQNSLWEFNPFHATGLFLYLLKTFKVFVNL